MVYFAIVFFFCVTRDDHKTGGDHTCPVLIKVYIRVGISVPADIGHIGKTDISVSVSIPADIYRPI